MGVGEEEREVWSSGAYRLSRAEGCLTYFAMATMLLYSFVFSMAGHFCASEGLFLCVQEIPVSVLGLAEIANSRPLTSEQHTSLGLSFHHPEPAHGRLMPWSFMQL